MDSIEKSTMAQKIVFTAPQIAELRDHEIHRPESDEVLLRTSSSLVSTGTELTAFSHDFDEASHWAHWAKYPFHTGYSAVAVVAEVGSRVQDLAIGDRVFARIPHTSHWLAAANQVVPIPNAISDDEAIWAGLAKIAFVGVLAAGLRLGTKVAVLGAGPIGQMVIRWAVASGASDVVAMDRNKERLTLARQGGATGTVAGFAAGQHDDIIKELGGEKPEVIVDATADAEAFSVALALVASHGRVVVLGDTGFPTAQRLTSDVVLRGITIVGAHDAHTIKDGDYREQEIVSLFLRLVASKRFPVTGLITHRLNPHQAQEAYTFLKEHKGQTMGLLFDWSQSK